ncbi:CatB-related O-acetyltransferase [Pseudophaeobacter sp.]|uniref:CatB-related O-acetyltransferase n=1 Tax=Pseudophaeobacter sp. TaxID=1971739 RepID=UPI0040583736
MATASTFKEAPLGNGKIEIGRFTHGYETINFRNWGDGANVKIGSFCSFSENIQVILGGQPRADWITSFPFGSVFQDELGDDEIQSQDQANTDVCIGNDVWIGDGVTIMPGVSIADGAVIAANATVVKDVGPYEIWGGNPATLQRKRFDDDVIAGLQDLAWWNLPEELIQEMVPLLSTSPNPGLIEGLKTIIEDLVVFEEDAA